MGPDTSFRASLHIYTHTHTVRTTTKTTYRDRQTARLTEKEKKKDWMQAYRQASEEGRLTSRMHTSAVEVELTSSMKTIREERRDNMKKQRSRMGHRLIACMQTNRLARQVGSRYVTRKIHLGKHTIIQLLSLSEKQAGRGTSR